MFKKTSFPFRLRQVHCSSDEFNGNCYISIYAGPVFFFASTKISFWNHRSDCFATIKINFSSSSSLCSLSSSSCNWVAMVHILLIFYRTDVTELHKPHSFFGYCEMVRLPEFFLSLGDSSLECLCELRAFCDHVHVVFFTFYG